ncbi:MAG: cytidylate kinase family protein [Thermodesulfobacteriota bacterium]
MAVVAISRKVGSYGEEIAALAAAGLGYRLVGRDEVHRLAQACDQEFKQACAMFAAEEGAGGLWERLAFGDPAHAALFAALNCELASGGDVVLVGRGAQIALQGVPSVLKVRVVAPLALRVERVMALQGLSREQAHEFVTRHDAQRRALIEAVFNADLSDASLYDLMLNTAGMTKEAAAELIVKAVGLMPPPADPDGLKKLLADLAFAKRVESVIKRRVLTSGFHDVSVTADGGAVTLAGLVADKRTKERAAEIAKAYPGVTAVTNQLKYSELSF